MKTIKAIEKLDDNEIFLDYWFRQYNQSIEEFISNGSETSLRCDRINMSNNVAIYKNEYVFYFGSPESILYYSVQKNNVISDMYKDMDIEKLEDLYDLRSLEINNK